MQRSILTSTRKRDRGGYEKLEKSGFWILFEACILPTISGIELFMLILLGFSELVAVRTLLLTGVRSQPVSLCDEPVWAVAAGELHGNDR